MAAVPPLFELDITKLKQFHADHFTGQPIPNLSSVSAPGTQGADPEAGQRGEKYEDGLGYYEDGVKRTLTDEQIEMFRHSEIERLRAQKRRDVEMKDEKRSRSADAEEERDNKRSTRPEAIDRNSLSNGRAGAISAKGKRKAHFDEPQGENAEVILDY
jgi:hypothetical protein